MMNMKATQKNKKILKRENNLPHVSEYIIGSDHRNNPHILITYSNKSWKFQQELYFPHYPVTSLTFERLIKPAQFSSIKKKKNPQLQKRSARSKSYSNESEVQEWMEFQFKLILSFLPLRKKKVLLFIGKHIQVLLLWNKKHATQFVAVS